MDAVFTVLNNMGTGSSNHYDEEVARNATSFSLRHMAWDCRHACASWACRLPGAQSLMLTIDTTQSCPLPPERLETAGEAFFYLTRFTLDTSRSQPLSAAIC